MAPAIRRERLPLAFVGALGKPFCRRIRIASRTRGLARLGLTTPQVLAQLGREPFLTGHILGGAFIHAKRIADKSHPLQPPLDIAGERDNRARLIRRCCSSVVERTLGKGEVGSSILPSSTILSMT